MPPAGQKLYLKFNAWFDTEASASLDTLTVQVSDHGYTTAANLNTVVPKGVLKTWAPVSIDISSLAGKVLQVRYLFESKDCVANTGAGVFVDDVTVQAGP